MYTYGIKYYRKFCAVPIHIRYMQKYMSLKNLYIHFACHNMDACSLHAAAEVERLYVGAVDGRGEWRKEGSFMIEITIFGIKKLYT